LTVVAVENTEFASSAPDSFAFFICFFRLGGLGHFIVSFSRTLNTLLTASMYFGLSSCSFLNVASDELIY
jgi:hypothetical protein